MTSELLVLDTWPLMEWLKAREPSASSFDDLIASARTGSVKLLISSLNLGEVHYNCCNVWGEVRAEEILAAFDELPIQVFHPKQADVLSAARLKARFKCSYADSFAVVLALEFGVPVVTGDPDFLRLSVGGIITVQWWSR